jgi:hypothetical protein
MISQSVIAVFLEYFYLSIVLFLFRLSYL